MFVTLLVSVGIDKGIDWAENTMSVRKTVFLKRMDTRG